MSNFDWFIWIRHKHNMPQVVCKMWNVKCENARHVQNGKGLLNTGICISWPPVLCLAPGPGLGPLPPRPPVLAPNLYLPAVTPNLCLPVLPPNLYLPTLAPNFYLPALAPNFYLPALVIPEPGLAYTNLVPLICIYWLWPTIFINALWICI